MYCFDSNLIIYIANKTLTEDIATDKPICFASISKIETLGYHDIRSAEENKIKIMLDHMIEVPLSDDIVMAAIKLRQIKNMSLGDSIVAATAIENSLELWTANETDFQGIDGLKIHNPLKVKK